MDVKSWLTKIRSVSLPFTDYCFPVLEKKQNCDKVFNYILESGKLNNWNTIEIRSDDLISNNKLKSESFYDHKINLNKQTDSIFNNFSSNTKRNITKALKSNIHVRISDSCNDLMKYYQLHCITRKRHGIPPQPRLFFKNIYNYVIKNGCGKIFLSFFNNTPIAGAVYFSFGQQVIYKFGASNYIYQNLRANNLIMWEAIRYFSLAGYKTLFLGRTEIDNDGLRRFKKGWNAEERIRNYYKFDLKKMKYMKSNHISQKYLGINKKLPIPILRLMGIILYKHSG